MNAALVNAPGDYHFSHTEPWLQLTGLQYVHLLDKCKEESMFSQVTCKCLNKQKSSNVFHHKYPSCGHSCGPITEVESIKWTVYL